MNNQTLSTGMTDMLSPKMRQRADLSIYDKLFVTKISNQIIKEIEDDAKYNFNRLQRAKELLPEFELSPKLDLVAEVIVKRNPTFHELMSSQNSDECEIITSDHTDYVGSELDVYV